MKEKTIQKKERKDRALILLLCVIMLFCTAGLLLCYAKQRASSINYEAPDGILSMLPCDCENAVDFEFTAELPELRNRRCALVIYDVVFVGGGLTFADMNDGQWQYSVNGNIWSPLILSQGERLLESSLSAGKGVLSLRATDDLDINASGGSLRFKLKLKESPGNTILWALIGAIAGCLLILVIYLTAKNRIKKRTQP